jgi:hypothetical protein
VGNTDDLYATLKPLVDDTYCKVWPLGSSINVYEISNHLEKATKYAIEDPSTAGEKTGVLFVAGIHGDEDQPPPSLAAAAQQLVALGKAALAPGADPAKVITIVGSYTLTQGRIAQILTTLDVFVVPVANPWGYDNASRYNGRFRPVNIDRNFDTLWNGRRNDNGDQYFLSGTPPNWECEKPGEALIGSGRSEQSETTILKNLMSPERMIAYVNFHTGHLPSVTYPWGFELNGTKTQERYCNPNFATLPSTPHDNTFKEYLPQSSLVNLQAVANAIATNVKAANGSPFLDNQDYWDQLNPGKWTAGPVGGLSNDYFFSLDVCNALTAHIEGGPNPAQKTVTDDNVAAVFAVCDQLVTMIQNKGAPLKRGPDTRTLFALPCNGGPGGGSGGSPGGSGTPKSLKPGFYYSLPAGPRGQPLGAAGVPMQVLPSGQAVPLPSAPAEPAGQDGGECPCCCVRTEGQCGRFELRDDKGFSEQLIFASAAGPERVLGYVTITNTGPGSVLALWDGPPPTYELSDQSAVLRPGNSITLAVGSSVKVVSSASRDPGSTAAEANGCYVLSWCCPGSRRQSR